MQTMKKQRYCLQIQAKDDFNTLCDSIMHSRSVKFSQTDFMLTPLGVREATGHYGEVVFWRQWLLMKNGDVCLKFHTDAYSVATKVFHLLNERDVLPDECSYVAKHLESLSRSIYDPR